MPTENKAMHDAGEEAPRLRCAKCRAPIEGREHNRTFPFCSSRCKQLDLSVWLSEGYSLSIAQEPEGEEASPQDWLPEGGADED